jgi:glyoxylase-like metal-dependent hydrolase (beta-lactamase superfamily II)
MSAQHPAVCPVYEAETGTWSYVVFDPASRRAAVVDPVLDFDPKAGRTGTASAEKLLAIVARERLSVQWILETHAHADHLSAGAWLKARLSGARLAIGEGITEVQRTFRRIFNLGKSFAVDGSQFDHLFANGEQFSLGAIDARTIPVPGHTKDSLAYLIGDALFVGDSLFMPDGGTARCDFPGGDAAMLYRSIQRLYALPESIRVFVCHDYSPGGREPRCETTIGEQKRENIHVRDGVSEAEFVALRTGRDATLDMPTLILPAIQVNIRAGELPDPEDNGVRYLKLPVDAL